MKPSFSSAEMRAVLADAVRLAAIDGTDIGTAARSAALLPIVRLAARALRVPVAQINMLTAGAQVPVASAAPNDPDPGRWRLPVGLEASYCQYVVASGEPLVITDARTHELVRGNLATTEAGIVAYAGVATTDTASTPAVVRSPMMMTGMVIATHARSAAAARQPPRQTVRAPATDTASAMNPKTTTPRPIATTAKVGGHRVVGRTTPTRQPRQHRRRSRTPR